MESEQQFLSYLEDFLSRSGMTPTAFGVAAANDPGLVADLKNGRSCSLRMVGRVRQFIDGRLPTPKKRKKRT